MNKFTPFYTGNRVHNLIKKGKSQHPLWGKT